MAVEVKMTFKISRVEGQPQFDSLPVAKIIDYPLEKRDYKPFAQAIVCINEEGFTIRIWAFEAQPERESSLRAVFALNPGDSERTVSVEVFPHRCVRFLVDGIAADVSAIRVHHFTGEDLQGLYWGATILLPHTLLVELYPNLCLESGAKVLGNFFKLSDGERPHCGSFFHVDFTQEPFALESLGDFLVVAF